MTRRHIILTIALAAAAAPCVFAWGPRGHRLSAYIAQRYLTPVTEAAVTSILDCSLECAANYPDTYRLSAWEGDWEDAPDYVWNAHTVFFTPDMRPATWGYDPENISYDDLKALMRKVGDTSCGHLAVQYHAASLRNWKEHSDSANVTDLKMIIHFLGDLHCPGHQQYSLPDGSKDPDRVGAWAQCNYGTYNGKRTALHKLIDAAPERCHPEFCPGNEINLRSYADYLDTWDADKIHQAVQGHFFDWLSDNARRCYWLQGKEGPVTPGTVVDEAFYKETFEPIVSYQLVVAGYRMAELLNRIFDPEYKGL